MTVARAQAPIVRMTGIAKRFGDCQAIRDASLEVAAGEIHALVGENGAGKVDAHAHPRGALSRPMPAPMEVGGRDVTGWSTAEAIARASAWCTSTSCSCRTLTVAENVVLGREPTRGLAIDMARAQREVAEAAERERVPHERARMRARPDRRRAAARRDPEDARTAARAS